VAADDRNAVGVGRRAHPSENLGAAFVIRGPQGIDHRCRAATHRGDVAEIDHHPAIAREPGFATDELVE
jgi:hypothetical protein